MRISTGCRLLIVVSGLANPVWAELPSPQLHRIEPVGLNAGGQVELTFLGADNEGTDALIFDHPGLKAEFVKEKTFKVSVASDVPAGTYDVRATGRFGVTNPRLFSISRQLVDVVEIEPNNTPANAQPVNVNSAVNGQSDGNNQDLFKVRLAAGQRIIIDCQSARLDTEMDGTLVLFSADGRQLASNGDYIGRDPQLDFSAPAAGDYVIEIRDLTYRAGYPYRLIVTDQPIIENVFPRAIQAGQTVELTIFGRNLGPGSQPSSWRIGDAVLDMIRLPVTGSTSVTLTGAYRFREHPTHHSVLPTAATCTLVGEQIAPLGANAQTLVIADTPTSVESEPNDTHEQASAITLPAIVSGRFDRERDLDWFTFETDEAGQYGFDVYCERIAGRADPYLAVTDEKGALIGALDDFGHRIGSFDGHLRDPSGMINLAARTRYRVMVKDTYQRGGARYQYVLNIRKALPDFFVACIPGDNNMTGTNIRQGGATSLDVVIHARDGFSDPVSVVASNLPPGLHAAPLTITGETRGTLVLWANEDAPTWTGNILLMGTSQRGGEVLRREVRSHSRVTNQQGCRPTRELAVSIRDKSPFAFALVPGKITVESGQKVEIKLQLTRLWPDFVGAVNYQPLNFPGQFQLGNGTIPAGQTETTLSINVQAGTRPGDYTLTMLGQAQVPFNKDPAATEKPNTLVSVPSQPISVTVTEPAKK
jgi:hypothetical protein